MYFACKCCGNSIHFVPKIASEDFMDEYNQSIENSNANTLDLMPNPKQDVEWPDQFLNKHKKNYPGKKDVIPEEDDIGVSTVAQLTDGRVLAGCPNCKSIYIYYIKEAGVTDPSSNDVYHNDNYRNNPENIVPSGHSNKIGNDFDKVNSNTDVGIEKIVRKYKYRKQEQKNESNI